MKEDNRLHLRFKVKEILERLVRKFGLVEYDSLYTNDTIIKALEFKVWFCCILLYSGVHTKIVYKRVYT